MRGTTKEEIRIRKIPGKRDILCIIVENTD
jgi:hypothetical protein